MKQPLILDLKIMLTPLRDDPVTGEEVFNELARAIEEMEVRVPFGKDDESSFLVEILNNPTQ